VSLDPQLWIAMGAAALYYHYATSRKASVQAYLLASVVVSTTCMLMFRQGWFELIIGQTALFLSIKLYERRNKP
jgi:hypothetical protein